MHLQITRSVSNISAMRGKNESTMMTSSSRAPSEVASAEMSCYGVFRKLEPVGSGDGGGERITAGRQPRQSRLFVPPISSVSPRVSAFACATAVADDDHDDDVNTDHDCCNFDRETYLVYGCDAATAITTTSTTVTTDAASTGGRDESGLSDFGGAAAWDEYDYCCTADIAVGTTVDLRGGAAAPFSHTPMGSTTKLVGIDANSDDTPKVRTYLYSFVLNRITPL